MARPIRVQFHPVLLMEATKVYETSVYFQPICTASHDNAASRDVPRFEGKNFSECCVKSWATASV